SATILTLIVLPVLYAIFDADGKKKPLQIKPLIFLIGFVAHPLMSQGQPTVINLEQAVEIALDNNALSKASALRIEEAEALRGTAWDLDKTEVFYRYDQNEIAENGYPNKVWGVQQSLQFPTVYGAQRQVAGAQIGMQEQEHRLAQRMIAKHVSKAYYEILYWQEVRQQYDYLDSLYQHFSIAASRRYELGE